MRKKVERIYVGMSGGVDSSVSATLLKKKGFEVTGVFIKVWQPDFLPCSWKEDRRDSMRVCAHLDIPFLTLDLEKEYKREVVDYMIEEYKKGRTPNPDVMCNRYVKFGGFFDYAIKKGANYVATGHYTKVKDGKLLKGKDKNKDQTYFLWTLKQEQLSKILFPVGNFEKSEVRKLARKFKLPNAEKKDSQGLCFVGKINMKEFLAHYIKSKPGNVLNEKREVIGTHEGALFCTIGQRHGFDITKKSTNEKPYFVISKNIKKNTITVSHQQNRENENSESIKLKSTNWIDHVPNPNEKYKALFRYRGKLLDVKIKVKGKNEAEVFPIKYVESVAPGQSIVIYKSDECLGGGIVC